jgi:hypothetical protein
MSQYCALSLLYGNVVCNEKFERIDAISEGNMAMLVQISEQCWKLKILRKRRILGNTFKILYSFRVLAEQGDTHQQVRLAPH